MIGDVEHIFMYLLAICLPSLENYLVKVFASVFLFVVFHIFNFFCSEHLLTFILKVLLGIIVIII